MKGKYRFAEKLIFILNNNNMFFKIRPNIESTLEKELKDYVYDIVRHLYSVYNELPCRLPEYIYQEALAITFAENGINIHKEYKHHPIFHGKELNSHLRMDMMVERERGNIIVECKAIESIGEKERHQLFSYMIATLFPIGIIANFGAYPKIQIEKYFLDKNNYTIFPF